MESQLDHLDEIAIEAVNYKIEGVDALSTGKCADVALAVKKQGISP